MSGDLFYGTRGNRSGSIVIVGEAWGREEFEQKKPFVGESGQVLDKMLVEAGIPLEECFFTNIVADRPPKNEMLHWFHPTKEGRANGQGTLNGLYPTPRIRGGLDILYEQLRRIQPKLIIGAGNYPFWAFSSNCRIDNSSKPRPTGYKVPGGIMLWRGSQLRVDRGGLDPYPYLPIIHPAATVRQWALRAPTVHDLRVRVPLALGGSWDRPARSYLAPPTWDEVLRYFTDCEKALEKGTLELAVDLETHGRSIIVCLGLCSDGESAVSIPFVSPTSTGLKSYWEMDQEVEIVRRWRRIAHHPNLLMIGQNFLYDAQYMGRWWRVRPRRVDDTMVMQHVLFPGTPKTLWYMSSIYCSDHHVFWKDEGKEWDTAQDITRQLLYNCEDALRTWRIAQRQRAALAKMNQLDQYTHKMREWFFALELMERGVLIDQKVRLDMTFKVMEAAEERVKWLKRVVPDWCLPPVKKGAKPWYRSAIQQQRLFYECMGLKSIHHRKTGNITVNDEALAELKLRYPHLTKLVNTILELRSLGVFQNNFLSAAIDADGRMRCSFNPAGPETMRWSSSENAFGRGTNLQNIPKGN